MLKVSFVSSYVISTKGCYSPFFAQVTATQMEVAAHDKACGYMDIDEAETLLPSRTILTERVLWILENVLFRLL